MNGSDEELRKQVNDAIGVIGNFCIENNIKTSVGISAMTFLLIAFVSNLSPDDKEIWLKSFEDKINERP